MFDDPCYLRDIIRGRLNFEQLAGLEGCWVARLVVLRSQGEDLTRRLQVVGGLDGFVVEYTADANRVGLGWEVCQLVGGRVSIEARLAYVMIL